MLREDVSQTKLLHYYIIRRNNHATGTRTDGRSFCSGFSLKQNTLATPDTKATWTDCRPNAVMPKFRGQDYTSDPKYYKNCHYANKLFPSWTDMAADLVLEMTDHFLASIPGNVECTKMVCNLRLAVRTEICVVFLLRQEQQTANI